MDAQNHTTTPALEVDDLTALAVAVGILPDRPVAQVHYDWHTGALVKVPAGARRLEVVR